MKALSVAQQQLDQLQVENDRLSYQHLLVSGMVMLEVCSCSHRHQMLAAVQLTNCATGAAAAAGADAAAGVVQAVADDVARSLAYRSSLLQQEQRANRMRLLMGKEAFIRTWFASYLYGQLSWPQLARMHALMFPFYPVPFVFLAEVAAMVEQQQQQGKRS
ncbi:hypothetical protein OEZ86_003283 [Tetradesmus obliquus]|nr:hypothetical protein OEZ86_003283 [Tetradesmus obliquus]